MKRLLLVCSLIYPVSAHGTPIQLDANECGAVLAALRNHVETIFLVQMARYWDEAKGVDTKLAEARSEISDALAHYDSKASRRGAHILGQKCLGETQGRDEANRN